MKIKLTNFISGLLLICIFIFSIVSFATNSMIDGNVCVILSCFTLFLGIYIFKKNDKLMTIGSTSVVFIFQFILLFGLVDVYYLFGKEYIENVSWSVSRWIDSDTLVKANSLHIMALVCYLLGTMIANIKPRDISVENEDNNSNPDKNIEKAIMAKMSFVILVFVLLYFLFSLLSGRIYLTMTYGEFISGISTFYQYMILFLGIGIVSLCAFAEGKIFKAGLIIFSISALVLIVTGNKGEVFYPVLASIGVYSVRNRKTPKKVLCAAVIILLFVIPFVTSTRNINGVLHGLRNFTVSTKSMFYGLTEMGGQFRITTKLLSEFANGTRKYLNGFSYYNPIINILDHVIPFSIRLTPPASYNFSTEYAAEGFNQVAESYANFGIIGVVGFYVTIGFLISRLEQNSRQSLTSLYYLGTISFVLINCLRNNFVFVLGQITIIVILHFVAKKIFKRAK